MTGSTVSTATDVDAVAAGFTTFTTAIGEADRPLPGSVTFDFPDFDGWMTAVRAGDPAARPGPILAELRRRGLVPTDPGTGWIKVDDRRLYDLLTHFAAYPDLTTAPNPAPVIVS